MMPILLLSSWLTTMAMDREPPTSSALKETKPPWSEPEREILLMEEIGLTTWDGATKTFKWWNWINYQPKLVQDFWTMNSTTNREFWIYFTQLRSELSCTLGKIPLLNYILRWCCVTSQVTKYVPPKKNKSITSSGPLARACSHQIKGTLTEGTVYSHLWVYRPSWIGD